MDITIPGVQKPHWDPWDLAYLCCNRYIITLRHGMTIPGVQKPHWDPWDLANLCCNRYIITLRHGMRGLHFELDILLTVLMLFLLKYKRWKQKVLLFSAINFRSRKNPVTFGSLTVLWQFFNWF